MPLGYSGKCGLLVRNQDISESSSMIFSAMIFSAMERSSLTYWEKKL